MNIISGIDIFIKDVDYDTIHKKILDDTFDTDVRTELEPLWYLIDVFIDRQARDNERLHGDSDNVYCAIEDYCIHQNVLNIPPLYRTLFDARRGFLTQVKFPCIIEKTWISKFPQPLKVRLLNEDEIMKEFRMFLLRSEKKYWSVLEDLKEFGFEYDAYSDEDTHET